jgi:uncharacterized membrane protein
MRRRVLNLLIALDQFLFCWVSFGHYDPDETLSAASWRWELTGARRWPRRLIDWLFTPIEADHCRKSWEAERTRRQLPREYA